LWACCKTGKAEKAGGYATVSSDRSDREVRNFPINPALLGTALALRFFSKVHSDLNKNPDLQCFDHCSCNCRPSFSGLMGFKRPCLRSNDKLMIHLIRPEFKTEPAAIY